MTVAFNGQYYNTTDSTEALPVVRKSTGLPIQPGHGTQTVPFTYVIPTTQLDTIGDIAYLLPYHVGAKEVSVHFNCGDADTGGTTLDMDICRRTIDEDGDFTDVILYNAGTAFSAALTSKLEVFDLTDPDDASQSSTSRDGRCHLILKVNATATTPAEVTISGLFTYR